jgi:diguanylate cyclase (GGDEF)-like protein
MPTGGPQTRPPVVLIIDDQEWSTRSLESVLAPNGYAVMRAYTAKTGIERATAQPPDLIFVSSNLPDADGVDLCRSLRESVEVSSTIPILITSPERPVREQRLAALEAGAWDFVSYPLDAQELLLRLDAFVRAKFESDRARERCLIDEPTGLYNLRGLEQRAHELRSLAYRDRQALACIVIAPDFSAGKASPDAEPDERAIEDAVLRLGMALKDLGRVSDAIGRLGQSEFAILAPSTDKDGAVKLVERLAQAMRKWEQESERPANDMQLRAGYDAVGNVRETPVEARDLLLHATIALRKSKSNGDDTRITPFKARRLTPS